MIDTAPESQGFFAAQQLRIRVSSYTPSGWQHKVRIVFYARCRECISALQKYKQQPNSQQRATTTTITLVTTISNLTSTHSTTDLRLQFFIVQLCARHLVTEQPTKLSQSLVLTKHATDLPRVDQKANRKFLQIITNYYELVQNVSEHLQYLFCNANQSSM